MDLAWADEPAELERLRVRAWSLRRAAVLAVSRYDLDEGVANLQRALDLCEPHERSELGVRSAGQTRSSSMVSASGRR